MRLLKRGEMACSCEDRAAPGAYRRFCRHLREAAYRRFGPGAPWVQRHVAHCPRCQHRLAALGKVDIALSVLKSQSHRLDLLVRANDAAIHMLSRRLRETADADRLKIVDAGLSPAERLAGPQNALVNVAACLAVLVLTKAGICTSLDKAHSRGEAAMRQYYVNQAGEDLASEVFEI